MAATTLTVSVQRSTMATALGDSLAMAARNLRAMSRVPQLIVFSTIQPVIFVLMFRFVFGGAIRIPGVDYVNYLTPGIFAQTVVFGGVSTVIGLSDDLSKGLIERFRSLPMARSAVLAGRTAADLVRNVGVVILMVLVECWSDSGCRPTPWRSSPRWDCCCSSASPCPGVSPSWRCR